MMYRYFSKEDPFSASLKLLFSLSAKLTGFTQRLFFNELFFIRGRPQKVVPARLRVRSLQASHKRVFLFLVSFVLLPGLPLLAVPPAYDPVLDGELLSLRQSILVATNAEPDIATWVRQQLGDQEASRGDSLGKSDKRPQGLSTVKDTGLPVSFLSQLRSPEEIMTTGDREADIFTLIQTLSTPGTDADTIDKPYRDELKGYYQGYLQTFQSLKTPEDIEQHLAPKVIMQSEIMGPYRIKQAMAYKLLSTNIYGDLIQGDQGGSHPVHRLENVFFLALIQGSCGEVPN